MQVEHTHGEYARQWAIPANAAESGDRPPGPGCAAAVAELTARGLTALLPLVGKKPAPGVRWKAGRHLDPDALALVAELHPEYNVGVLTGSPSGLIVVDVDDLARLPDLEPNLPPTLTATTGRGRHYYYRLPAGTTVRKYKLPGVDVQAEGAYVVAPGSVHPGTGTVYEWENPDAVIAPAPSWLLTGPGTGSTSSTPPHTTSSNAVASQADRDLFRTLWAEAGLLVGPGQRSYPCPLHEDGSPSLSVNADTCAWTCHAGCGSGYLWHLWALVRPGEPYAGPVYRDPELAARAPGWLARFWEPWPGRRGPSQQRVYGALVTRACKVGRPVVGMSEREAAELANMGKATAQRALHDLCAAGLLRRFRPGRVRDASQYELVCVTSPIDFGSEQTHTYIGGLVSHTPAHDAWHHRALGPAWATALHLCALGGSTVADLAAATGRHRTTVRAHLHRLADAGMAELTAAGLWTWALLDDLDDDHLHAVAVTYGTVGRAQRRRDWHRIERAAQEIALRESRGAYMAEHWYVTDPDTGRQELVTTTRPLSRSTPTTGAIP